MLDHPAQQLRAQVAIGTVATAAAFIPFGGGLIAPLIIGTAGQAAMLYNRSQGRTRTRRQWSCARGSAHLVAALHPGVHARRPRRKRGRLDVVSPADG
jgi:hypothetical protein